MKIFKTSKLYLLVLMFFGNTNFAQQKEIIVNSNKQIFVHYTNYSVEKDKKLHKELGNDPQFKIDYSCISTGMIMISCVRSLSNKDLELLIEKLNFVDSSYNVLSDVTLKDLELSCSAFRSN